MTQPSQPTTPETAPGDLAGFSDSAAAPPVAAVAHPAAPSPETTAASPLSSVAFLSPVALVSAERPAATRLLGAHMPTAGGLHNSLLAGKAIGCTAVQLFTGSPRQWSHPPLTSEAIAQFRDAQEQTGIPFTVAHDSYLINLAAPTIDILEKSRHAFRGELDRAERLGIPWVVTHMGAHLDQGEDEAIARLVDSLKRVLEETDREGYTVGIALETTAGQGTGLGWRFDEIGHILRAVGPTPRLGVCLDTCHIFAAGYDLRDQTAYTQTFADFDRLIGLHNLKVIHANDCLKTLGCRVDRHSHIGEGEIGLDAFARLVTDPRLLSVPILVETPDSETMHTVNLSRLRQMANGTMPGLTLSPRTEDAAVTGSQAAVKSRAVKPRKAAKSVSEGETQGAILEEISVDRQEDSSCK